jgi:hypothetical protein
MQTLPVLQSVSYMQAKAGAEQRQSMVAMIRLRMVVPLAASKNHTTKCPNLDRLPSREIRVPSHPKLLCSQLFFVEVVRETFENRGVRKEPGMQGDLT